MNASREQGVINASTPSWLEDIRLRWKEETSKLVHALLGISSDTVMCVSSPPAPLLFPSAAEMQLESSAKGRVSHHPSSKEYNLCRQWLQQWQKQWGKQAVCMRQNWLPSIPTPAPLLPGSNCGHLTQHHSSGPSFQKTSLTKRCTREYPLPPRTQNITHAEI